MGLEWVWHVVLDRQQWIERLKLCYLQQSYLEASYCAIMVLITTEKAKEKMYYNEILEKCISTVVLDDHIAILLHRWNSIHVPSKVLVYRESQKIFYSQTRSILYSLVDKPDYILSEDLTGKHQHFVQHMQGVHFSDPNTSLLFQYITNPWERLIIYSTIANVLRAKQEPKFEQVIKMNELILRETEAFLQELPSEPNPQQLIIQSVLNNFYALTCNEIGFLYDLYGQNLISAKPFYEKSVQYDPNNAIHIFNRAVMHSKTNQYTQCLHDFQRTLKLDPTFRLAYLDLALFYKDRCNDYHSALKLFIQSYHENLRSIIIRDHLENTLDANSEEFLFDSHIIFEVGQYWYRIIELIAGVFRVWEEHYLVKEYYQKAETVSQRIFLKKGLIEIEDDNLDQAQFILSHFC